MSKTKPIAVLWVLALLHWAIASRAAGDDVTASTEADIKSILPHATSGEEVCFEGTFAGRTLDMEDWSKVTTELVPGLEVGGKPATRPVPGAMPGQDVSRIALHLAFQEKADTSFDFLFTLMTKSKGASGEALARSGCAWGQERGQLDCWIECDGGSFSVDRVAGTDSVDLGFASLSMQAGCEGGGAYRLGVGGSKTASFRLEKVPLSVCKPLAAWNDD